ncbi:MAG TPA: hypothetical protein VKZ63_15240, partial [Kofleriaceae bacterium]|nr:hypothetical protein [Kofleriaceae bacterium]
MRLEAVRLEPDRECDRFGTPNSSRRAASLRGSLRAVRLEAVRLEAVRLEPDRERDRFGTPSSSRRAASLRGYLR